jgi:hypothetical protein
MPRPWGRRWEGWASWSAGAVSSTVTAAAGADIGASAGVGSVEDTAVGTGPGCDGDSGTGGCTCWSCCWSCCISSGCCVAPTPGSAVVAVGVGCSLPCRSACSRRYSCSRLSSAFVSPTRTLKHCPSGRLPCFHAERSHVLIPASKARVPWVKKGFHRHRTRAIRATSARSAAAAASTIGGGYAGTSEPPGPAPPAAPGADRAGLDVTCIGNCCKDVAAAPGLGRSSPPTLLGRWSPDGDGGLHLLTGISVASVGFFTRAPVSWLQIGAAWVSAARLPKLPRSCNRSTLDLSFIGDASITGG